MYVSCCWLEAIASCITAIATFGGIIYAGIQYYSYKKREKTAILLKYNERYATDPNIQKVVNYLLWKGNPQYLKDDGSNGEKRIDKVLYGGEYENDIKPTKNQIEMFMRFFEELQISIDTGRLDKEIAKNLFAYYAYEINSYCEKPAEDWLPEDYYSKSWSYFRKFVNNTRNK